MTTRWYGMPNCAEPRYGLVSAFCYAALICRDRRRSELKGVDFWPRFRKITYGAGIRAQSIQDFFAIFAHLIAADLSQVIVRGLAIPLEKDPSLPRIAIISSDEITILETTELQSLAPSYWLQIVEDCCTKHHYTDEDILEVVKDINKTQWIETSCRLRKLEDDQIKADRLAEIEKESNTVEVEVIQ